MDLKPYFTSNTEISFFNPDKDNQDVLKFMDLIPMRMGGIELLYDRRPSFQRLLQCQSSNYMTILASHKQKTAGLFSLSSQKKWINGEKISCGYIGDFRTDGSKDVAKLWRKNYGELLKAISSNDDLGKPQYFLTAILKKNVEAVRSLASPKKNFGFHYELLEEVDMVNVYGMLPWYQSSKLSVVNAAAGDFGNLKKFLNICEKRKLFGSIFDESDDDCWRSRSLTWDNFSLGNFLLIKNSSGQILACTLPWNPGFAKRMIVKKAPFVVRKTFALLRRLGMKMPDVGETLETIYLTHLNIHESIDPADAVKAFCERVFKDSKMVHMVSFPDNKQFSSGIKGWIKQRFTVLLFSVSADGKKMSNGSPVSFEMGLV